MNTDSSVQSLPIHKAYIEFGTLNLQEYLLS